MNSSSTAP